MTNSKKSKPQFRTMWMFPRNIRNIEAWKLVQIVKSVEAVEGGVGTQRIQDSLYDQLAALGVKSEKNEFGVYNSGGFRTYLAQLSCLGLFWYNTKQKRYELTEAGEQITEANEPMKVLRCQLLRMQYPSVYGFKRNVCVSPNLSVKPFAFLLDLLNEDSLGKKLTEEEIAIAVIYGRTWNDYENVVEKILRKRQTGVSLKDLLESVDDVRTPRRFHPTKSKEDLKAGITDAVQIANTAKNYLKAAQLVLEEKESGQTFVVANQDPSLRLEIDPWLDEKRKIEPLRKGGSTEAWEQRFGRYKKTKSIKAMKGGGKDGFTTLIEVAYINQVSESTFSFDEEKFISEMAQKWGKSHAQISKAIEKVKPEARTVARDSIITASLSGGKEALKLEKAVTYLFRNIGFNESFHTGNKVAKARDGAYPDIYIKASTSSICGWGDTKATIKYNFSLQDREKLGSYYKDSSEEIDRTVPCKYFVYIAAGFQGRKDTIDALLRNASEKFERPVSAVTVGALLDLEEQVREGTLVDVVASVEEAFQKGALYVSASDVLLAAK